MSSKMKRCRGILIVSGLTLFATGCVTVPKAPAAMDFAAKRFEPPEGKANIYVARRGGGRLGMVGVLFQLAVDGKPRGAIAYNRYFLFQEDPGTHSVAVLISEKREAVTLHTEAGQNYFLEVGGKFGISADRPWIKRLGNEQGREAVRGTSLAQQSVRGTSLAEQAVRETPPAEQAVRETPPAEQAVREKSPPQQAVASVPETKPRPEASTGTCFAARPDGVIITAYHVVKDAESIRVHFGDGIVTYAKLRTFSAGIDLAVLHIDPPTPHFLPLAQARSVRVGDQVFTMGYPVAEIPGQEPQFTAGAVSSLSGVGGEESLLQISVPVQPGNSGGPLVNERAEVVGIVTSTAAVQAFPAVKGTLSQNVNWAVKAEYARPLFNAPNIKAVAVRQKEAVQRVRRAICMVEVNSR